jgi:hypothetical protein
MPRGFGRLPFLTRRASTSDRRASEQPTMAAASVDPDRAPVGPPVLLPASIVSQVLFDATELTPVWARPRPDPEFVAVAAEPVAVTEEPATPKRARRAPVGGAAKAGRTDATPRRTRRSDRSPNADG